MSHLFKQCTIFTETNKHKTSVHNNVPKIN
uniref:Uncharacterized protein n=1 Tax=Anguilla anguilla TaxID=7936 RepID=A0A0E9UX85_ANGAN